MGRRKTREGDFRPSSPPLTHHPSLCCHALPSRALTRARILRKMAGDESDQGSLRGITGELNSEFMMVFTLILRLRNRASNNRAQYNFVQFI